MKTTKKVLAIAVLMSAILTGCNKDEVIKIPNSEIPDMFFRDYLLMNFDTDLDGFISEKEARAVKEIDLSNRGVYSLAGIEYFTSIEKLIVGYTPIESLDLTAHSMLEILDCSGNYNLTTLFLPDSKRLKSINCSNTRLDSINLNEFELLEDFTFINGPGTGSHTIRKLDIINSSVKRVVSLNNGIQNLNISNLPDLEYMSIVGAYDINGNHTVDLAKSTKLKSLTCKYIHCEMNISQCTALEELIWEYVDNKTIDLSKNTALKTLYFIGFEMKGLDISNSPALETLHFTGSIVSSFKNNPALKNATIYLNESETLDLSSNTLLENLRLTGGNDVSISNCKNLIDLTLIHCNTKTINLQQSNALKNVLLSGCNSLTSLCLSGCLNLDSLRILQYTEEGLDVDISNCRNLRFLYLDVGNNLNKLNASGCTALKSFEYQDNNYNSAKWNLTSLNMSNCTSLTSLSCYNNKLTDLDVSGCTALTTLECGSNNLENLKIGANKSLAILSCDDNKLKKLDVSDFTALTTLTCTDNNLEELKVNGCVALKELRCAGNKLKELDVHTCLVLKTLNCLDNNDLKTLILNKNHQITVLHKDDHTQIVLQE